MTISLRAGLISAAFFQLILPWTARCAPHILFDRDVLFAPEAITQTVVSTYIATSTVTAYATVSADDSSVSSTSTASASPVPSDTVTTSSAATTESTSLLPAETSSEPSISASVTSFSTSFAPSASETATVTSAASQSSDTSAPVSSTTPPTQTTQVTSSASASAAPAKRQVMAYYPDWTSEAFPPEKIDFNRLDWIDFAFAVPKQDFDLGWDGSEDAPMILDRLVGAAHAKGKRVKVSVGGWTGSKYFSQACSTPENRQILATNILAMYNRFDLDGIDIDWEYPGQRGDPQNVVSPGDSDNFLAFLKTLRQTLPPDAKITAATMTVPFVDEDENPMGDVSAFAKVLDWILVMNYDSWGSSSNPGPNAPLNDSCGNSTQSTASALSAIEAWTTAGFPTSQIVLGVPSYGYLSRSTVTRLRTRGSDSVDESEQAPTQNEAYHPLVTASRATSRNRLLYDYPRTRLSRSFLELTGVDRNENSSSVAPVEHHLGHPEAGLNSTSANDTSIANATTSTITSNLPLADTLYDLDVPPADSPDDEDEDDPVNADAAAAPPTPSGMTLASNEDGGTDNGQIQFRQLVEEGILSYIPDSDVPEYNQTNMSASTRTFGGRQIRNMFTGNSGFTRYWDDCSNTPYLRSEKGRQVVSYDDPQSLEMKAMFANAAGLLGVNMFDIHGDTDHWDLTDAVRRGLDLV